MLLLSQNPDLNHDLAYMLVFTGELHPDIDSVHADNLALARKMTEYEGEVVKVYEDIHRYEGVKRERAPYVAKALFEGLDPVLEFTDQVLDKTWDEDLDEARPLMKRVREALYALHVHTSNIQLTDSQGYCLNETDDNAVVPSVVAAEFFDEVSLEKTYAKFIGAEVGRHKYDIEWTELNGMFRPVLKSRRTIFQLGKLAEDGSFIVLQDIPD